MLTYKNGYLGPDKLDTKKEGARAYWTGLHTTDNPYSALVPDFKNWLNGWLEAFEVAHSPEFTGV